MPVSLQFMKRKAILIILVMMVIFISGCISNNSNTNSVSSQEEKDFSPMQKKPLCSYDKSNLNQYDDYLERGFGLRSNQYTLKCVDADITRGGFVEAEGDYVNGSAFELLHHWGWCSSGGSDCGWTKCFAVEGNNELFETIKNKICNEIDSRVTYNEYEYGCTFPTYDNTNEIRQKCLNGEYEYIIGNKKVISVIQDVGRCFSSVKKGSSNCLGQWPKKI